MSDKNMQKKSRKLLFGLPMMIVSIVFVLLAVPIVTIFSGNISSTMKAADIKMNPNIDDGYLIAEFEDPTGDLLRKVPSGDIYKEAENALDISKFAVKKVEFRPFSGVGIAPRLNLTFEFNGKFPNPLDSEHKFSLPVIHTYINAPNRISKEISSNKTADVSFVDNDWDYQVIIDGLHEQARIFDTEGKPIGTGLGIYLDYKYEKVVNDSGNAENIIKTTRMTVGLPIRILGDPAQGEWSYYVLIGLADLNHYSMLLPAENENEPQIFDVVMPKDAPPIEFGMRPELMPLRIRN